jgi:hypothetical protein
LQVIRKVKEHGKKKKKEMKKLGIKEKAPKDPGLPSQWPFKEELIKEFQFKKDQILADEKRRKEERKRARLVRLLPRRRAGRGAANEAPARPAAVAVFRAAHIVAGSLPARRSGACPPPSTAGGDGDGRQRRPDAAGGPAEGGRRQAVGL